MTLAQLVRARAADPATGLRFGDWSWSWAEVVQESADRAAALAAAVPLGGRPSHRPRRVGLLLDDVPDHVFWVTAGALAGFAVLGLSSARTEEELAADIRAADLDLVITEPRWRHLVIGSDHGLAPDRVLDIHEPAYAALVGAARGAPLPAAPTPADAMADPMAEPMPASDLVPVLVAALGSGGAVDLARSGAVLAQVLGGATGPRAALGR